MRQDAFIPHPLVRGGQLQTLAGQVPGGRARLGPSEVETLLLPDGDRTLLCINAPTGAAAELDRAAALPVVVLLHGLGGSSESTYILRITCKLNRLGYVVVRFNHRGCGVGGAPLARQIYHAGRIEDVRALLAHVHARWPRREAVVAAFSLSANMLLRYLGTLDAAVETPWLRQALAVCPPVDLERCSQALARPDNWHIDRYFTRRLVRAATDRARLFPDESPPRFPALQRVTGLRHFDELYTAPRAGFPTRDDYYATSSAKHSLHRITVPTTLLAAADDPMIPPASFDGLRLSPQVQFRLEATGGHMGFISRRKTRYGDYRWMDAFVVDWVRALAAAGP